MPLDTDPKTGALPTPNRRLTYHVYMEKGTQQRELPFVLGILGNFQGHKVTQPNRRFVTVNRDSFEAVLRALSPELKIEVPNTPGHDDSLLRCDFEFRSLADFSPEGVANQVSPLRKFLEIRASLAGLRAQ